LVLSDFPPDLYKRFIARCEQLWPGAMLVARPNQEEKDCEMAFEPKNDSGSLFRNDRRESDSHPEYRGDGIVNGEAVWINAGVKESKKTGKKFFSLSFKPKQERIDRSRPLRDDLDDAIPF
jgi:hypothetical protein